MSVRERHRLEAFSQVKSGQISIGKAGELCGLSHRQARRVWKRYKEHGDAGLVHQGRGRQGNHRTRTKLRERVLAVYRQEYAGFGAVLASEYLARRKLAVPSKTLWRWLRGEGLLAPKRRRSPHRSRRLRRACFGELVQMDGSTHDWFEGRQGAPICVLFVMVDDATGRVLARFYEAENTAAAFDLFGRYVQKFGVPVALYVDKDSIYTVNNRVWSAAETLSGKGPVSQFGRAMGQLDVEVILAHSPQAKGRVERMNGTLQDRLVKGLRVARISTLEKANAYLEDVFLPELNARFARVAREPADVHRQWPKTLLREEVLCVIETRTVSRDWCVVFEHRVLQLDERHQNLGLAGRPVKVLKRADGQLIIQHQGRTLAWRELAPRPPAKRGYRQSDLRPALPVSKTPPCPSSTPKTAAASPAASSPQSSAGARNAPAVKNFRGVVKPVPLHSDSLRSASLRSTGSTTPHSLPPQPSSPPVRKLPCRGTVLMRR
jgi:transposase